MGQHLEDPRVLAVAREVIDAAGQLASVAARRSPTPDALEAANRVLRLAMEIREPKADPLTILRRAADAIHDSRRALGATTVER